MNDNHLAQFLTEKTADSICKQSLTELEYRALARLTLCFCPPLRLIPLSPIYREKHSQIILSQNFDGFGKFSSYYQRNRYKADNYGLGLESVGGRCPYLRVTYIRFGPEENHFETKLLLRYFRVPSIA